jgi:hypothetical protein
VRRQRSARLARFVDHTRKSTPFKVTEHREMPPVRKLPATPGCAPRGRSPARRRLSPKR